MEKEFISYEQALALKELGFNEHCLASINRDGELQIGAGNMWYDTKTPLYQQAFRWFREKYNLFACFHCPEDNDNTYEYRIYKINEYELTSEYCKTYDEAELACLQKLIEIATNFKTK